MSETRTAAVVVPSDTAAAGPAPTDATVADADPVGEDDPLEAGPETALCW